MTCALLAPLARRDDIMFVACIPNLRRSSEVKTMVEIKNDEMTNVEKSRRSEV